MTKLSPEQVKEIKEIYRLAERVRKQEGARYYPAGLRSKIAQHFGISTRLITHIRRKRQPATKRNQNVG